MNGYIFNDRTIEHYKNVIFGFTITATVISFIGAVIIVILGIKDGSWNGYVQINGRIIAIVYIVFSPFLCFGMSSPILNRIDCAKIFECVVFYSQDGISNAKIKMTSTWDRIKICMPMLLDFCFSLIISIIATIFNVELFFRVILGCLLALLIVHIFSYVTIIFYILSCKIKRDELSQQLPQYVRDKKSEMQRKKIETAKKNKIDKILKEKEQTREILEQCGMKFFLKYYKMLVRLPIRDIEVDEDFTPEEKNERLVAAKSIITQGFSKYAAQHILDNYSDMLSDGEKAVANDILAEQ